MALQRIVWFGDANFNQGSPAGIPIMASESSVARLPGGYANTMSSFILDAGSSVIFYADPDFSIELFRVPSPGVSNHSPLIPAAANDRMSSYMLFSDATFTNQV
jgi:hypothetical protein